MAFEVGSILVVQKDGRGWGRACTSVPFWECGWEDLRDGCAALLVFRVGSARTLMGKGAPYDGGGALVVRHRGRHTPWRSHPCRIDLSLRKKSKRSLVRRRAARSTPCQPGAQCCARGQWEAIVDNETWWRAQEILDITERVTNTSDSTKRKHLVSGLYRCAVCGGRVMGAPRGYRCAGHVR